MSRDYFDHPDELQTVEPSLSQFGFQRRRCFHRVKFFDRLGDCGRANFIESNVASRSIEYPDYCAGRIVIRRDGANEELRNEHRSIGPERP